MTRVLVTGAGGQVGSEVVAVLGRRGEGHPGASGAAGGRGRAARAEVDVTAADHALLDVADRDAVLAAIVSLQPDVVIHCAAWTAVDACEDDPERAFAVNAFGTRNVAEGCARVGAHLCTISTDYVFDGTSPVPYVEWDAPNPTSVYGRSKLGGERECGPGATVIRTSWVSGRRGANMVKTLVRLAAGEGPLRFVDDQRGCPTVASDLAGRAVELALARLPGVFHVTNQGETTWFELARTVVGLAGGDPGRVLPISTKELEPPRPAPRPANSVLDNLALRLCGFELLPDWREATARLVSELTTAGATGGAGEPGGASKPGEPGKPGGGAGG